MHAEDLRRSAFTLLELVVVIAVVALLVALLLPAQASSKADVARIHCVNNLKHVGLAFRTWAGAHNDRYPMRVTVAEGGPPNQANFPTADGNSPYTYQIFGVMSNELQSAKVVGAHLDTPTITGWAIVHSSDRCGALHPTRLNVQSHAVSRTGRGA